MKFNISEPAKNVMDALVTSNYSFADIAKIAGVSAGTAARYIKTKRYAIAPMRSEESIELEKSIDAMNNYGLISAHNAGFHSRSAYAHFLGEQRKTRVLNKEFSILFRRRLAELGMLQKDFAKLLDVTQSAVSRYASGYDLPRENLQEKVFEILRLPYETIDEILEEK